jgi:hypothetical protein
MLSNQDMLLTVVASVGETQLPPDHLIPDSETEVVSENELTLCENWRFYLT